MSRSVFQSSISSSISLKIIFDLNDTTLILDWYSLQLFELSKFLWTTTRHSNSLKTDNGNDKKM